MINWGFTAQSGDCCSYRIQPASQLLAAQGCCYHFAPACSPRTMCNGCASPDGCCCDRTALMLAVTLVVDQAPPCLPKSLQAQGWWVLDQGTVGVRPLPRQWRGDGIHLLRVLLGALPGKGHVLGPDAVWGTQSLDGDRARERGNVCSAYGSRWLGTEERLLSPLAPSSQHCGLHVQAEARAGSGALGACTFSTGERQSLSKRHQKRQQILSCPRILGTWCSL